MAGNELINLFLEFEGMLFNVKKPYKFSSGLMVPVYPKARQLISLPEQRKKAYEMLKEKIDSLSLEYGAVASIAKGTMFFAAILAWEKNMPLIAVAMHETPGKNSHALTGILNKGTKVLVIEDMVTNGASTTGGIEELRKNGAVVTDVVSLFSFEMPTAITGLEKAGVRLHPLSTYSELIEIATRKNIIQPNERKLFLEWTKDPVNWGEKMGYE